MVSRTLFGFSEKCCNSRGARPLPAAQTRSAVARWRYFAGTSSRTAASCRCASVRKGMFTASHWP
eukprot:7636735-Alexandrium_andersonii.AAC.1